MKNKPRHLAIITARSGSKGLPDKNIRILNGLPLMAWTIRAAAESGIFDRIILSTDSEAYAKTGVAYGAEVPWLRHALLASDEASSVDVVTGLIRKLQGIEEDYEFFTLLQPTSPLRSAQDIIGSWNLMQGKKADAVVGVCPCDHPPQWANTLPEDLCMEHFLTPAAMLPRQALVPFYRINGAIYMARTSVFMEQQGFYGPGTFAFLMPLERSVDIDGETDFLLAEAIMKQRDQ